MSQEKVAHIVFICDENYVMPTVVAITSLCLNKARETHYSIHILASDISADSKLIFQGLKTKTVDVEIIDQIQTSQFQKCEIENLHVSTAALYKFNIAKIFPQLDKVLYLDGDILIQKDLFNLYETDISNVYAAVVKDYKPMTYNPPQVKKLSIEHSAYFNSGVMLLNLKKFREDDLSQKLFDYRLHGINYFMDQDALNVVFQEKVIYLSFLYNVMSSVMGFFKTEDILDYYKLSDIESKEDIYKCATIVHLCTKYKPWDYSNVPFADEWNFYYNHSPITEPRNRQKLEPKIQRKLFAEIGQKMTGTAWGISNDIIVSLTSFPARIQFVSQVIDSIFNQTVKVDKVVLWLAEDQFPYRENSLPIQLLEQAKHGLEIRWCDDLKPHKKYYYTMEEFPDSIVITIDDDVIYSNNLVETLLNSYIKYPYAVSAMRAHLMTFGSNGNVLPYKYWKREYKWSGEPSMSLLATGIGGVLYPPHIMCDELFNKNAIKELCINADDLWLKIMQVIVHTPVVVADKPQKLTCIDGTQETALWKNNDSLGENDTQLLRILEEYNLYWGESDTLIERMRISSLCITEPNIENVNVKKLQQNLKDAKKEIAAIHASWSYRIGRFITFIPRKIRGGIRCYQEHGWKYTWQRVLVHLGVRKDAYR